MFANISLHTMLTVNGYQLHTVAKFQAICHFSVHNACGGSILFEGGVCVL